MTIVELDLDNATIANLAPRIQRREVSPVEIVESTLRRIEKLQPVLGSFTTIASEHALLRAREAEQEIAQGRYRGPFHGIPYTLKDVVATANMPTTWGDPKGVDYKPKESATIHTLLDEAGGILLGKVVSEIGRGQGGPGRLSQCLGPHPQPGHLQQRVRLGHRGLHGARFHRHRHRRIGAPSRQQQQLGCYAPHSRPHQRLWSPCQSNDHGPGGAVDQNGGGQRHNDAHPGRLRPQGSHQRQ